METKVLNNSNYLTVEAYLSNPHNPTIVEVNEDVKLEYEIGKDELGNPIYKEVTLRFSAGDILFFNGGTLNKGILSGTAKLKVMSERMFQVYSNGHSTVTFDQSFQLNVPYLRPEWFGAKGNLVFETKYDEKKSEYGMTDKIDLSITDQYNTDSRTDDSDAINETIRVAEELSIKTVKFNAVNYFVEESIVIRKGNLRLEGSGALLREDQWFEAATSGGHVRSDVWNSRTSTLFCPKGVDLITFGEELAAKATPEYTTLYAGSKNPGDPVVITGLQLWTEGDVWMDYNREKDDLPSGINFCSNFTGPLWPLIIERCHFRNFYYAIHLNTRIDYPVTNLRIDECAFFKNMYCLYSRMRPKWEDALADKEEGEIILQNEPWLQTSWSLEFTRNKCHDNGYAIKMAVNKGPCRVEYNNLEGMSGISGSVESDSFIIDLELGQRAAWVTMRHNNRDGNTGSYEASNLCYFEGVILNTDEDAEVCNCIYENVPYQGKKLQIKECTTDGTRLPVGSVFLRELPARPLKGGVSRYYKLNPQAETAPHTHVYMQTPMGRMLMRYYYEINVNYEHVFYLVSQEFDYEEDGPLYVTIDFPLINECNTQPLDITTHLQYEGETVNRGNHTYLYYDKGGFFNVRQQFIVCHETAKKFKISLGITAGTLLPIEGRFFVGNIVVMFSDAPLDMNFRLMDNRSVTLKENDSYLVNRGDILTIEGFLYVCLEDGYMTSGKVGFTKKPYSNVIKLNSNTILPAGSIWICKGYMFKILAPHEYTTATIEDGTSVPRYTQISYLTETDAFDVALSDELERYDPDLLSL